MKIDLKDIEAGVSVVCSIGEIRVPGTYETIGYFRATGTYKPGGAGHNDAGHILGMVAYAQARFCNQRWMLDLSELSYVWGDEMDWVLAFGGGDATVAVVVGPGCMPAISTLDNPRAEPRDCLQQEGVFGSLEAAYTYLVQHAGASQSGST